MFTLHPRTLFAASFAEFLLAASAMVVTAAALRRYRGPGLWALGFCGFALSSALHAAEKALPFFLGEVGAHTGVVVSQCLVSEGLFRFIGVPRRRGWYLLPCAATFLGFLLFTQATDSYLGRAVVFWLFYGGVVVYTAWLLHVGAGDRRGASYWFVQGTFAAQLVLMAVRLGLLAWGSDAQTVPHEEGPPPLILLALVNNGVAMCMALILFAGGRFAREIERGRADLAASNAQLREALDSVRTLRGLLPICSYCLKIRDTGGAWRRMEDYITAHTEADVSHGICPDCIRQHYPQVADEVEARSRSGS